MKKQDFYFDLPEALIAQQPAKTRSGSRLLVLHSNGQVEDKQFLDLIEYLNPNDCLIFNNTKVIPARLFGQKQTGGKVELLVERVVDEVTLLSLIKASNAPKPGTKLKIADAFEVEVMGRDEALFELKITDSQNHQTALELIEAYGHMPLPPYIQREDVLEDKTRYQTVYSKTPGAVAAPTAGLHFDDEFLARIHQKGIQFGYVTLHVGAGTFKPVQVENIAEHKMHSEVIEVLPETVKLIEQTKANGGRVVAVGSTSMRSLESAAGLNSTGQLAPFKGESDIFITPGYEFKVVDLMLTNFHLPESTLMMLVSAFTGHEHTMNAYQHAIKQKYRFFSYGDAMLVYPKNRGNKK